MASSSKTDVAATLKSFRDTPVSQAANSDLQSIFRYLVAENSPADGPLHWFCAKADDLIVEAASFLVRLHAYNSPQVIQWRQRLQTCLAGCSACVKRLQEIKAQTRQTYFGAFSDATIKQFYTSFSTWELETILEYCKQAQISPDDTSSPKTKTLLDIPPSIALLALANLHHLRDPRIMRIIRAYTPDTPIQGWPAESPPAGLFLLLMDEKPDVRAWAYQQIALYTTTPMAQDHFLASELEVLDAATSAVTSSAAGPWSDGFAFPADPAVLWPGYCTLLRFVPVQWMQPGEKFKTDLRKVVIAHLSDTGAHFSEVLKAFLLLLVRLGPKMWEGEGEEYPQVVFDTIKNNSSYASALEETQPGHNHWLIQWMESYVKSLSESPGLPSLFPLMIQYLCEELQHERYKDVRASAISVASKLLDAVLSEFASGKTKESPLLSAVLETLDIHASTFTSVAFTKAFLGDTWTHARAQARSLVQTAMKMDAKLMFQTIYRLAKVPAKGGQDIAYPKVREQLWRRTYESVLPNDPDAIAAIVGVLATIAHVDPLHEGAFGALFANQPNKEELLKVTRGVNRALAILRTGFSDAVSRFLDFTESTTVLTLLGARGMTEDVMAMMFSPLEDLREPVQALVGLALDAESRADCLRALLQNNPDGAFAGMCAVLENFVKFTTTMPEACSMSKALALCLTDVIDVLCGTPDGLLHKTQFLRAFARAGPEVQLPKWWGLMAQALAHVFQRTPRWADFFENDAMITWMRDALIFGRDMLAARRVIEGAARALAPSAAASSSSSSASAAARRSHIGARMLADLQPVLLELTRWLRLTDEELLFQAFALLQTLLAGLRDAGARPGDAALLKLQKHVRDARTPDPRRPQTKLDAARVDRLQDALAAFEEKDEESEDEVQIVAHVIRTPPKREKKERRKEKEKEREREKAREKGKAEVLPVLKPKQQATLTKSAGIGKPLRPEPLRRPSAKSSISNYFTADDQRKLDAASTIPTFRSSSASSSKPSAPPPAPPQAKPVRIPGAKSDASSSAAPSAAPSSSSESSSDEDVGLDALVKLQKTPTIKKAPERRQVKMLDLPGQAKNPALERLAGRSARDEARRTGLRLKPDISALHRAILSWDYDHDGPEPPPAGERARLAAVPDRFESVQHYRRVFEPLLLMECWAQLQQAKEAPEERYACQVLTRQYSDDWVDLDVLFTDSVGKDWALGDADIVLLRPPEGRRGVLCKVQNYRATHANINATLRMLGRAGEAGPQINTTWMLSKVLSLTTVHREYSALMALPYYDLCPVILNPKLPEPARTTPEEVSNTMKAYNLNEPQAKAILSALRTDGFSLIQGPPGTGKTSTLCGLVQAYLAKRGKPATVIHAGRQSGPADREPKKKLLLCAPSNAAIDEITFRLKEGVSGAGRAVITPKVVRVGGGKINIAVRDVSLDYLVEQKMASDADAKASAKDVGGEIAVLRAKLEAVKRAREQKMGEMHAVQHNTAHTFALEDAVRALNKERGVLISQLDKLRDQQKSNFRALDAVGRRIRAEILQDADVICCTLAGSGHELLEPFDFEMVVIDEAVQAVELSSLIPMKYRCSRCIMIGDPQQLPPTVISTEAMKYRYNQSLFVRLQKDRPDAVHLLSIQYRMHPDISILPSRLFYSGRLKDGPDMAQKTQRPWHNHPKFGPYRFYNVVRGVEEVGKFHSFVNRAEADVAVALYNRLQQEFASRGGDFSVGVVTMYRAQMLELRRAFEKRFGATVNSAVDFNTVDGFQGQEKDIIILSCVRAGPGVDRVGFLADTRRMNVALTRAKCSVFILGNAATLERSNDDWRTIVQDARSRQCLSDVDISFFTTPGTAVPKIAPAPRTKAPSKATASQPLPELSTPKQLAAQSSAPRPPPSHPAPPPTPPMPVDPAPPPAAAPIPVTVSATTQAAPNGAAPVAGQKRPLEDGGAADGAQRRPPPPPGAKRPPKLPKLPPPKEKPSIFLPSKRPLPKGGDAGPSTNRRRV